MFQWLFTQYREPGKLHFGSKWMNLHGRLLIGSPESLGMGHLMEAVRRSLYYLRADRVPPVDSDAAYEAWTKDRLYASQVEQVAERWVAQAGFLVIAPFCAVLAVLAHWLGN